MDQVLVVVSLPFQVGAEVLPYLYVKLKMLVQCFNLYHVNHERVLIDEIF